MPIQEPAPKPVGPLREVSVTGCLIPWGDDEQPVLLEMPGSPHLYLPIFTKIEALRAVMTRTGVSYAKVKHIDDGPDFLSSIPVAILVMKDPWFTIEGKIRFTQIIASDTEKE